MASGASNRMKSKEREKRTTDCEELLTSDGVKYTLRTYKWIYILPTKEVTDGKSGFAQGPCGAHTHETDYYHGEEKGAYVGSLRMP